MPHTLFAFFVSNDGLARELTEAEKHPNAARPENGYEWLHFNAKEESCAAWMKADKKIDGMAERILLAGDSRPRTIFHNGALLINFRGVNLNPGSQPEDMIGIRFFVESNRVISVERRPLKATRDISRRITTQSAPKTTGGFVALFGLALADRMNPTIVDLNEQVDGLEEKVDQHTGESHILELSELRREAIMLRRYLAPQRDALNTLSLQNVDFITDSDRLRIREAADQATRINEELDAIRERCAIVKDQLVDQRAEEMNRNMMLLSVVAAIFLPLGLISGMFGINVGGMPWVENPWGFAIVCAMVIAIALILLGLFKKAKWL